MTLVDSYSLSAVDSWGGMPGDAPAFGQSFACSENLVLNQIKIKSGRANGTETGDMYCKLYAHSGTYGTSSVPTGSALDTAAAIDVTTLPNVEWNPANLVETTFTFSGGYEMQSGLKYVFATNYGGDNWVLAGWDGYAPAHGGNMCYYNGSTWEYDAAYDLVFEVYGTAAAGTVVKDLIGPGIIPFAR